MKEKQLFRFAIVDGLNRMDKNQAWLAMELKTSPDVVSNYVRGKRIPNAERFLEICDILSIDPGSVVIK